MDLVIDISQRYDVGVQHEARGEFAEACQIFKDCIHLLLQEDSEISEPESPASHVFGYEENLKLLQSSLATGFKHPKTSGPNLAILLYGPTGKNFLLQEAASTIGASMFTIDLEETRLANLMETFLDELTAAIVVDKAIIFVKGIEKIQDLSHIFQTVKNTRRKSDTGFLFVASTTNPCCIGDSELSWFQVKLYVPLPTRRTRELLLQHFSKHAGIQMERNRCRDLAKKTKMFTAADLKSLIDAITIASCAELNGTSVHKKVTKTVLVQALKMVSPSVTKEKLDLSEEFRQLHAKKHFKFFKNW